MKVCLEMTGMGASLEVEQPSMRRKKSRVQTHGHGGANHDYRDHFLYLDARGRS